MELIHKCGLIDTRPLKDLYQVIGTYARRRENIDFILITPIIQQSVTYSHISPYNEIIVSDHMALIVDIDHRPWSRDIYFSGKGLKGHLYQIH